jgi:ribosome-associated translation inhibitor RaiA
LAFSLNNKKKKFDKIILFIYLNMPTQKESLAFVRKHKQALKGAGLKAPSSMKSGELNSAIDKAVDKLSKEISNEWKKMKLKSDQAPEQIAKTKTAIRKQQLKQGTLGKSAPVPVSARDKRNAPKPKPKAVGTVKMTAPGMTKLPPKSMLQFDIGQAMKKGNVKIKKKN